MTRRCGCAWWVGPLTYGTRLTSLSCLFCFLPARPRCQIWRPWPGVVAQSTCMGSLIMAFRLAKARGRARGCVEGRGVMGTLLFWGLGDSPVDQAAEDHEDPRLCFPCPTGVGFPCGTLLRPLSRAEERSSTTFHITVVLASRSCWSSSINLDRCPVG
ncbi:hypothetical protein B0T25DRAFT_54469 [Lasiosphaeria hispida]|uniref:Uncharacterized protein n=1 Tax=Lasiosphaeria hispida TaxID=260671 RepID=A0AAJ0MKI0_9PEZI|nr:hypothetical protein B0T25DRAFT_54469 [Lasiosphaeria hispida]